MDSTRATPSRKTERRLALVVLGTALLPLVVAVVLANSLFKQAAAIWFDPNVGRQLDRGVTVYKDYVRVIKDDMRHQTDAIAADEALRTAALHRDGDALAKGLATLFHRFPELVAVRIEDEAGGVIGSHDRGNGVDEARERSLEVRRPLGADASLGVAATFAVNRDRLDELEEAGPTVARYHQLEASRSDLYRGYLQSFAALLGITIAVTLMLGTLLARGVTKRISRLAAAINLVAKGDLSVRVPVTGSDELTDLAATFNHMLGEVNGSRSRIEYLERIGAWQEMARRLAHEIKNPLTPIQLAVQECHRKYAGDDPRFRGLLDTTLEIVEEEVATLRRLVGDFSNFARLPRAELRRENIKELLAECREQLTHLGETEQRTGAAAATKVRIDWESDGPAIEAAIDRQMLRRVLVNLVENATQAIEGSRLLHQGTARTSSQGGHVVVSASTSPSGVRITVEDDGPGVRVEARGKIFDPYFTTKPTGTGLGLAIVKKVIVEHGGTVDVSRSERLGGAKFVVTLPTAGGQAESERGRAREAARAAGALVS